MMGRISWIAVVVCILAVSREVGADDADEQRNHDNIATGKTSTCSQLCQSLGVKNGCTYAPKSTPKEEVVVVTNGESDTGAWQWDTVTMVISPYFASSRKTGRTACVAHSKGKRYGLIERIPAGMEELLNQTKSEKTQFIEKIETYQQLLMADHIVFDLLKFFTDLKTTPNLNQSIALAKMSDFLSEASQAVTKLHDREVFCIVPWQPPCEKDCRLVRQLLGYCHILLMSPDSYLPPVLNNGTCFAQATIPVSHFLYGVDRYIKLRAQPNVRDSIIAGIPWHGYVYKCSASISDDKCPVQAAKGMCFDNKNRERWSLSFIHSSNIPGAEVKMDMINQALYYNWNNSAQLWFENFTTLHIKYALVKDLKLRGLSIWYGEDLTPSLTASKSLFAFQGWDFLMHEILHKSVYNPVKTSHFYADTVAGVGVGCLLLGTALGVTFSCIAFRRRSLRKRNRPFKLDEDEDDFRDDEGL